MNSTNDAQGQPEEPVPPLNASTSWAEVRASMRRFWYLLPLLCGATVAAALFAARGETELYRSESDVVFAPSPRLEETYEAVDVLSVLSERVPQGTFVELIDSPIALQDAVAETQVDPGNLEVAEVRALIAQELSLIHI